jgi:hypothetical protein
MLQKKVRVIASNEDWTRSGIRVQPGDVVVLFGKGSIRLNEHAKESDADGTRSGSGRLEAKVGTGKPLSVGKNFVFKSTEQGILKLRVEDSYYIDNAGAFEVYVLFIPAGVIPEATEAEEQND